MLQMAICVLVYILEAKLYYPPCDIKGVKTYIDDILVLSKEMFPEHMYQIIVIFDRICGAGLKVVSP